MLLQLPLISSQSSTKDLMVSSNFLKILLTLNFICSVPYEMKQIIILNGKVHIIN